MAPTRKSDSFSGKKSTSSTPTLKQGTILFQTKRTSSNTIKKPTRAQSAQSAKPSPPETISIDSSSSDEESPEVSDVQEAPVFRSRAGRENSDRAPGAGAKGKAPRQSISLDLEDRAGKWNKHLGAVRAKMGNLEPIHAEGQTKVHHILRVFDLSDEYGPCIGVTRMQRWERANALGLNPPSEVREILSTKQAIEQPQFSHCVFEGEV
ncbi:hypothetical protein PLICRDRAFT_31554 [Plicaturopsis crispa FD-325 SS-3]|nr:hypothetical protein PLICRDRAFT_31554 [Plicaturopsis crispa FD-325 SS-3]